MHYSRAYSRMAGFIGEMDHVLWVPFFGAQTYPRLDRVFPFFSSDLLS